jgi:histidyl-tRNA synthetase
MDLSSLPGFRDFYPEDAARREYVFKIWKETALRYGFSFYDGPPLETVDLYRRKSGDELMGQLYNFTDKGEREITLRPEMTPSLARMIARKGQSLPKPIKWFSIPQLFRYERQQRGRLREHYQFNCDILGESSVAADAELVALLIDSLRGFGLQESDLRVRVSDRPLLAALITAIGIDENFHKIVFSAIDKITREPAEKVKAMMLEGGVEIAKAEKVLSLFSLKKLNEVASLYDSSPAVCERIILLQQFFGTLESMGLGGFVEFDLTIVRGLAYYTGIVFEAFDRKGEFRAISGGGRYDQLVQKIGGVEMPALGFGMGDVVLGELLTEKKLWPEKLMPLPEIYAVLVDEGLRSQMLGLVHQLRNRGFRVDYSFTVSAVGKQFKSASNRDARIAIVLGPEEWKRGALKLKDLQTREEIEMQLENLESELPKRLRSK